MSARAYWNLPGADDDERFRVDYAGIWNPDLTPTPTVLRERAKQRLEMQNLADPGGNRKEISQVGGLDQVVEGMSEAGQGGRRTSTTFSSRAPHVADIQPHDFSRQLGPGLASLSQRNAMPQPRASMSALSSYGGTPQRYGPNGVTADEVNSREFAPTFEQQRQGALLADMDSRTEHNIRQDSAAARELFDIGSGQMASRARSYGDVRRNESLRDADAEADRYFRPGQQRMRGDQDERTLEQIKQRYTDPAIAKAQADIEAARVRAAEGIRRADTAGAWNYLTQQGGYQQRAYDSVNDANARLGAGALALNPRADVSGYSPQLPPGVGAPQDPGKTMSSAELQEYAQASGKSLQEAFAEAQQLGYAISR
jgi:hypothetical protein